MLDKSINSALLAPRAQIIRDHLDGLHHVEALLVTRGIEPSDHAVRRKIPDDCLPQGGAKLFVLDALRTGSKSPVDLAGRFTEIRPEVPRSRAMVRVYRALYKMRVGGGVVKDVRVWRLAP